MYLGELVRLILIDAIKKNLIFEFLEKKQLMIKKLTEKSGCFQTSMISDIEGDSFPEFNNSRYIINEIFGIENATVEDYQKLQYICECISKRAANLVAIGISGLIKRINERKVVVGIDGSVYRFHPKFDTYMRSAIKKLISPEIQFDLMLSEDGSGRGAALVAAVASQNI